MKSILERAINNQGSMLRSLGQICEKEIDFSTNDYLKLSTIMPPTSSSFGATGSRLLSGNHNIFLEFEKKIACDQSQESALLFSSGYQANLTTLSTIANIAKPTIFFDRLNHASLYDALIISGATYYRYRDISHLEELLNTYKSSNAMIVTETLFGMDGHFAEMPAILDFCRKYGTSLYLDEAHAIGVYGKYGYGIATDYDLSDINCIIMGSFGKGLGCSGAYIASSQLVQDTLINFGRGFIYSTAPSPALMEAAYALWTILPSYEYEREKLLSLAAFTRNRMLSSGFDISLSESHIIPILMESNEEAINAANHLDAFGIRVSLIRQPSATTPRLRVALNIEHSEAEIIVLSDTLQKIYYTKAA